MLKSGAHFSFRPSVVEMSKEPEETAATAPARGRAGVLHTTMGTKDVAGGSTQAGIVGVLAPQHLVGVASAFQRIDLERTRFVSRWSGVMMSAVPVTWLLRNPRGRVAPEAVEGDILRVSDGITTIYLALRESAAASTSRGSVRGEQCLKPRGY